MEKGVYIAGLSAILIGFNIVIGTVVAKIVNPIVLVAYSILLSVVFCILYLKPLKKKFVLEK